MSAPPIDSELHPALALGLDKLLASADALSFKTRLEILVYELPPEEADALMMLLKESRGAWAVLLEAAKGRALFVGDALSGTPLALATLGFEVTVLDRSWRRTAFALHRGDALAPGTTSALVAGRDKRLPFRDRAFDVVVLEGGLPSAATGWAFGLEELRRVADSELLVTADNRLGYKRSTGRRGDFRRDPRVLLRGSSRRRAARPRSRRREPRSEAVARGATPMENGPTHGPSRSTPTPSSSATWSPWTRSSPSSRSDRASERTASR